MFQVQKQEQNMIIKFSFPQNESWKSGHSAWLWRRWENWKVGHLKNGVLVDGEMALWLRVPSAPAEDTIIVKVTNAKIKVEIYRKCVEIKFMTEINFKSV